MNLMQALYDSEINVEISSVWDGGFDVKIGDTLNGFVAEATNVRRWAEVETWLAAKAVEHYPDSAFARRMALQGGFNPADAN